MKINELCGDCKHFEHECNYDICYEFCRHPDKNIVENFIDSLFEDYKIKECKGFEK